MVMVEVNAKSESEGLGLLHEDGRPGGYGQ